MADGKLSCLGCLGYILLPFGLILTIPLYYLLAIFATRWLFFESAIQFSVDMTMVTLCNTTSCNMGQYGPVIFMGIVGPIFVLLSACLCAEKYSFINRPAQIIGRNVIAMFFSLMYWVFKAQCGCADLPFLSGDSGFFFNIIFNFCVGVGPGLAEYAVDEKLRDEFILRYCSCRCCSRVLRFSLTPYLLRFKIFRPNGYNNIGARNLIEEHAV
jgi:hypothetical protein